MDALQGTVELHNGEIWLLSIPNVGTVQVPLIWKSVSRTTMELTDPKMVASYRHRKKLDQFKSSPNLQNYCNLSAENLVICALPDGQIVKIDHSVMENTRNYFIIANLHCTRIFQFELDEYSLLFVGENGTSCVVETHVPEINPKMLTFPGPILEAVHLKDSFFVSNSRVVIKIEVSKFLLAVKNWNGLDDTNKGRLFDSMCNVAEIYSCRNVVSVFENERGNVLFKTKFGHTFNSEICDQNRFCNLGADMKRTLCVIGQTSDAIVVEHREAKYLHEFKELILALNTKEADQIFEVKHEFLKSEINQNLLKLTVFNKSEFVFHRSQVQLCVSLKIGDHLCEAITFYLSQDLEAGNSEMFYAQVKTADVNRVALQLVLKKSCNDLETDLSSHFVFDVSCQCV